MLIFLSLNSTWSHCLCSLWYWISMFTCIFTRRLFVAWHCAWYIGTEPIYHGEEAEVLCQADQPMVGASCELMTVVWVIVTAYESLHTLWIVCIYSFVCLGFYRGYVIKLLLFNFNYSNERCACSEILYHLIFLLYHLFNMKLQLYFMVNLGNDYTSPRTSILWNHDWRPLCVV